jgi:hypothetical protein
MSKSALVNHVFGSIDLNEPILPDVINITSSSLILSSMNSGSLVVNQFTAGSTHVSIPLEAGVSFKFIQAQPNNQVYITASISGCPSVFSGHYMCGTTGSSFTNSADVDFADSNGAVGDSINVICDGAKYYVTGNSANRDGLFHNQC